MSKISYILFFSLTLLFYISNSLQAQNAKSNKGILTTVPYVNLQKYSGLWYEIAKIPNRFQSKCVSGTTAEYTLRDDNKINVMNRCIEKDGKIKEARGIAKVENMKSNSKLKVSFVKFLGLSLFWGDYWIIGLGDSYEYAIVGTPDRKYGWILSRSPKLDEDQLQKTFTILLKKGYNPDDFQMTKHEK